jgi:hypothetical protein
VFVQVNRTTSRSASLCDPALAPAPSPAAPTLESGFRWSARAGYPAVMIWLCTMALGAEPLGDAQSLPSGRNPAVPTGAAAVPPAPAVVPLVVEAKVPVEVLLEGAKLGELYFPGEVRWTVTEGRHTVRLYVGGKPEDVPVDLVAGSETRIVVGRNGISSSSTRVAAAAAGPSPVEFRLVGSGAAQIRVDSARHAIEPGQNVSLTLPAGNHALSVRSSDGTVIWASGTLEIGGGEIGGGPLVVLIAEGRMPEVSGRGAFHAGGG